VLIKTASTGSIPGYQARFNMNLSDILGNFGISADEVSEQYGIFGPVSKRGNWEKAKYEIEVKSYFAIWFDSALDEKLDVFVDGLFFVVERVELYLDYPECLEFSVWITILCECRDTISYVLGIIEEKFELDEDGKSVIAVLFWIIRKINSIKKR
jgi:hypothetical protein